MNPPAPAKHPTRPPLLTWFAPWSWFGHWSPRTRWFATFALVIVGYFLSPVPVYLAIYHAGFLIPEELFLFYAPIVWCEMNVPWVREFYSWQHDLFGSILNR